MNEIITSFLKNVEAHDLQADEARVLLENIKEFYDTKVYLPSVKGGESITPIMTTIFSDAIQKDLLCVHMFLDEKTLNCHAEVSKVNKELKILEVKFGWVCTEFIRVIEQRGMPFFFVFHFSDHQDRSGGTSTMISEIELRKIRNLLTMDTVFNDPQLAQKIWQNLHWVPVRQTCYDFALANLSIEQMWMFAMGTMLYIIVEGEAVSHETLSQLQQMMQARLTMVAKGNPLEVAVSHYKDRNDLIEEGVAIFGSLLFYKDSSHNSIKRWFNARRRAPIIVAKI